MYFIILVFIKISLYWKSNSRPRKLPATFFNHQKPTSMKPKTTSSFRNYVLGAIALTCFILLTFLPSCKEQAKTKVDFTGKPTCMKLTKAQLQDWVTNNFTKPGDVNYIKTLVIYTSYPGSGSVFAANARGLRTDEREVKNSRIDLDPIKNNCSPNLPEHFNVGIMNTLDKDQLAIFDASGNFVNGFDYLQFTPKIYVDAETKISTLFYDVVVVNTDGTTRPVGKGTLPCPPCPYCVPKCPDWCTPACVTPTDTTIEKNSGKEK